MSHLIRILLFSVLLLVSACTESVQQSIDSSAATTVASTFEAQSNSEQQTTIAYEPTVTSIFCSECQLVEVTRVVDGDTIDTSIGPVRFFGVDTPERGKTCFTEATEFSRVLIGSQVRIEDGPRLEDTYGRRLAYVYDRSGNSIEVQLLAAGLAEAWRRDGQHMNMFIELEATARSTATGCLWSSIEKASMTDVETILGTFDPIEHLADFIIDRELATTHVFGFTDLDGDEIYFASGRLGLPTRSNTSTWLAEELDHGAWIIETDGEIWEVNDSAVTPTRVWP
jgi:endonuclease YncB( thermonuclease family)